MNGIVVGCDSFQEWLLPWWWGHYTAHSSRPVAFIDMGMTAEGIAWCKERGQYIELPEVSYRTPSKIPAWEKRYGDGIWTIRPAWLKKPHAMLQSPFHFSLWLDLDCQVKGSLEPFFTLFDIFGFDAGLVRDRQDPDFLLPNEVHYNSGVIAFLKTAPFLHQWIDAIDTFDLPSDQEYLSRAIFLHKTNILELPQIYNWFGRFGPNENAIIHHYSGGLGKIEILQTIQSFSGIGAPKPLPQGGVNTNF